MYICLLPVILNRQSTTNLSANSTFKSDEVDADEDGVGGDDAADALRYLVATTCPP